MTLKAIWFIEPAVALLARLNGAAGPEGRLTASSDEQYAALMAGEVDVAVTSMDNVMDWNLRDAAADFAIIAQIERTTRLTLMGRPGVTSFEDIRNGDLLVDAPANGFVVAARMVLAEEGLNAGDYSLVPAGGVRERMAALLSGAGDATLLGPPFDFQAADAGAARLAVVNDRYPDYPGQGLVIRRSALDACRADLATWLADLSRAIAQTDRPDAARQFADSGMPAPVAQVFAASLPDSLTPDRAGVDRVISQRRALGLRGGDVSYDDLVPTLTEGSGAATFFLTDWTKHD